MNTMMMLINTNKAFVNLNIQSFVETGLFLTDTKYVIVMLT